MQRLVLSINGALPSKLPEDRVRHAFAKNWPDFQKGVAAATVATGSPATPPAKEPKPGSIEAMVTEILQLSRATSRALAGVEPTPTPRGSEWTVLADEASRWAYTPDSKRNRELTVRGSKEEVSEFVGWMHGLARRSAQDEFSLQVAVVSQDLKGVTIRASWRGGPAIPAAAAKATKFGLEIVAGETDS
jgi:hypothetical protein